MFRSLPLLTADSLWWRLFLAGTLVLGLRTRAVDLDVEVPAGTPVEWGSFFPAVRPARLPLFPMSGDRARDRGDGSGRGERSSTEPRARPRFDIRFGSSFGLVRILTLDLAAHLNWIRPEELEGPISGVSGRELPPPVPGDPTYWISLAPWLRLLLHPHLVSEPATLVHLCELGSDTVSVARAAKSEASLRRPVRRLEELVASGPQAGPTPRVGTDVEGTMLRRFLFEELLRHRPYDPTEPFGERIFLFGDRLEPLLREYASDRNPTLRRNAITALGRFPSAASMKVLLATAMTSEDAVAMVRALAALGRHPNSIDWRPLAERLGGTSDRALRVALIEAIARVGLHEAVPELLKQARLASPRDSDMLMALVPALARLDPGESRTEVTNFARLLCSAAETRPRVFAPRRPRASTLADVPDRAELRGKVIHIMGLCLWIRATADPEPKKDLMRILDDPRGLTTEVPRSFYASNSLRTIPAPARFLVLETLATMGEQGIAALRKVALDSSVEPMLRGYALANLPYAERGDRAIQWIEARVGPELEILALELVAAELHPRMAEAARSILARLAEAEDPSPEFRHLSLVALRLLGERQRLVIEDLAPLVRFVSAPPEAFGDLPEQVRAGIRDLVRRTALDEPSEGIRRELEELLDLVIKHRMRPPLQPANRTEARDYLLGQLSGVRAHRSDPNYLRLVVETMLNYLLGYAPRNWNRSAAEFEVDVLLEEEVLLAIGRTQLPQAAELLVRLLENRRNRNRGIICLALGMVGQPSAARTVASFLLDEDPFVRYCAYVSLKELTGRDAKVDWMYGPSTDRFAAAENYLKWILQAESR